MFSGRFEILSALLQFSYIMGPWKIYFWKSQLVCFRKSLFGNGNGIWISDSRFQMTQAINNQNYFSHKFSASVVLNDLYGQDLVRIIRKPKKGVGCMAE